MSSPSHVLPLGSQPKSTRMYQDVTSHEIVSNFSPLLTIFTRFVNVNTVRSYEHFVMLPLDQMLKFQNHQMKSQMENVLRHSFR